MNYLLLQLAEAIINMGLINKFQRLPANYGEMVLISTPTTEGLQRPLRTMVLISSLHGVVVETKVRMSSPDSNKFLGRHQTHKNNTSNMKTQLTHFEIYIRGWVLFASLPAHNKELASRNSNVLNNLYFVVTSLKWFLALDRLIFHLVKCLCWV